MIDPLDLRILKILCTDSAKGIDFAHVYGNNLFVDNATATFAGLVLKYLKAYRACPTRRTLKEWSNQSYANTIDTYWSAMESIDYPAQEYPFDLDQLKEKFSSDVLKQIGVLSSGPTDKALKDISLKMQALRIIKEGKTFTQQTVDEHIPEFEDHYNAKVKDSDTEIRIKTRYSAIDYSNGGFRPAELFLVGGETGGGKSILLMNMGIQMWMQGNTFNNPSFEHGYNITFFSLEMPYDDMFARFMARMANVPERSILDGALTFEQKDRVKKAEEFIKNYKYKFDIIDAPRGVTIEDIEMRFQDACLKYEPHVVIVDYLGLMHSHEFNQQQDWLKMGGLSGELHEFGRAHNVVMGSALQLTDIQRGSKEDVKQKATAVKVGGHRIGRSSMILHHANFYIQIETRAMEDEKPNLMYHIVKNRRGPKPKGVLLEKNFANSSLKDIRYIPPEQRNLAFDNENQEIDTNQVMNSDISERMKDANIKRP